MLLNADAALARYEALKHEVQRDSGGNVPRQFFVTEALHRLSHSILWPFRIVAGLGDDQVPVLHVVLNHGGQGNDEGIWMMRGWHRETDVIRLTVTFRNLFYSGHVYALESGSIGYGLEYAMPHVQEVMRAYTDKEDDSS